MLGNLFRECGVTERLSKAVQNELMNIVTVFLGISVGATATANTFLSISTLKILCMGVVAFGLGTAGGLIRSSDQLVSQPFLWLLVFLKLLGRKKIPQTSYSCMPWDLT